jgi:hypothetical protein
MYQTTWRYIQESPILKTPQFPCNIKSSSSYTGVLRGKVNILGFHSIDHSKKKRLCEHVSYSEQFLILRAQYF